MTIENFDTSKLTNDLTALSEAVKILEDLLSSGITDLIVIAENKRKLTFFNKTIEMIEKELIKRSH